MTQDTLGATAESQLRRWLKPVPLPPCCGCLRIKGDRDSINDDNVAGDSSIDEPVIAREGSQSAVPLRLSFRRWRTPALRRRRPIPRPGESTRRPSAENNPDDCVAAPAATVDRTKSDDYDCYSSYSDYFHYGSKCDNGSHACRCASFRYCHRRFSLPLLLLLRHCCEWDAEEDPASKDDPGLTPRRPTASTNRWTMKPHLFTAAACCDSSRRRRPPSPTILTAYKLNGGRDRGRK